MTLQSLFLGFTEHRNALVLTFLIAPWLALSRIYAFRLLQGLWETVASLWLTAIENADYFLKQHLE